MSADTATKYDLVVIGGGSGGLGMARRAAEYGASVAVVEKGRMGGTCVNVGCVPKKVMWSAASLAEAVPQFAGYGLGGMVQEGTVDWAGLKERRDAYVARLNGIYERNVANSGIALVRGVARVASATTVEVTGADGAVTVLEAEHVVVATGGRPKASSYATGCADDVIDSDGFFELEELPSSIGIIGAGYIAVEVAGIMAAFGADVHLFVRGATPLRYLDPEVKDVLMAGLAHAGVTVHTHSPIASVTKDADGTFTITGDGDGAGSAAGLAVVLEAIGRVPNTDGLGLEALGVELAPSGHIVVDDYQNTSVGGVYALGDVCSKRVDLTPVAIAAGRKLAARLFNGDPESKLDYSTVATVIFSHPPIGTVGLTEQQAVDKYGADDVKVYNSKFTNMYYAMDEHKPKTAMKIVCAGATEVVVGLHVIGRSADEIIQGFSIAVTLAITKAQLDSVIAIHPTAGEELVTMR